MTHVLISGGSLQKSAILTHVKSLCQVLRDRGTAVTVAGTGCEWPAEDVAALEAAGVRFLTPAARGGRLSRPRALAELFAKVPGDAGVVYCVGTGNSHRLIAAALRARLKWVPTVYHEIVSPPGRDSLAARNAAAADYVIANSAAVADEIRRLVPRAKVRELPFLVAGADPQPPAARPPETSDRRTLNVAYLGRLVCQKRPDRLVETWGRLAAPPAGPARLDLYGFDPTGEIRGRIAAAVRDRRLEATVRLHGEYRREDLPRLLADKDLVVLPSEWEGLPLILVEAMQQGVPFVATAAGGTAELGVDNPDVVVTGTAWDEFEAGFRRMCGRIRAGEIDRARLYRWATSRYGAASVAPRWVDLLGDPAAFFRNTPAPAPAAPAR